MIKITKYQVGDWIDTSGLSRVEKKHLASEMKCWGVGERGYTFDECIEDGCAIWFVDHDLTVNSCSVEGVPHNPNLKRQLKWYCDLGVVDIGKHEVKQSIQQQQAEMICSFYNAIVKTGGDPTCFDVGMTLTEMVEKLAQNGVRFTNV